MTTQQDNWEVVKALFEAALEEDAANRSSFLKERCPDASLRAEVERLLAEHDEAGAFLSTPALGDLPLEAEAPAARLSEGELLAGRFRIIRFIAGGGMGEVYEAEDQELRERVAVKIIRPEILAQPNAMARFKREVHLARQVTHPNVCRIFDLFRHRAGDISRGETVFISMELLHGKTLGERLKAGGRMSTDEAEPVVRQMASALAAAHKAGIIHRDFKPGNVVLVEGSEQSGERAVVTDFGLALRSVTSDETASLPTGQGLLGTPAYMSPEQIEGRPATPASDIYALGLVMYEMVTNARPFADPVPFAEAAKRIKQPAPSPRILVPDIAAAWESAIRKCLESEPDKRFQDVQQVAEEIAPGRSVTTPRSRHFQVGPGRAPVRTQHSGRSKESRRMRIIATMLCVLVLSLFAVLLRHYIRRQAPIQFAERDWILVTDFANKSGERMFDRVVRDLTVQSLSQSTYVNVVSRLSALEAAKRTGLKDVNSIDEQLGQELCLRENYKALLTGDIFKEGSRYVIAMKVVAPGTDSAAFSDSESIQSPEEIFACVDRLTARIRRALGESLSRIEINRKPLAHVTTSSLEALQRYSTALDLYGQGEYARCIALTNDAVERDPKFAMAHLLLAQAYEKMGDEERSRGQLDLARAGQDRVGERERHLILAVGYSYQLMNEKAAEEYQHLLDIFPDDVDALKGFAYEAFWAGHPDQAISAQRRALALSPGDADCYDTLMTLLVRSNRFGDALAVYDQARLHHLTAPNLNFLAALATWGAGDLVRAREMLEALSNDSSNWKVVSRLFVGKLLAFQGRMGESIEVFRTGLDLVQNPSLEYWIPNFQYQIARVEIVRGENAAARIECRRLRKDVEKVSTPINLQRGGRLSIQVGNLQSAKYLEAIGRRQVATHPDSFSEMELHGLAGDIALASGDASTAEREQRSALTFRPWYAPYFSLGEACEAAGKWECAVEAYSRYLDFEGTILRDDAGEDWALAHYSLARAYVKSGDPASGEAYYQKFLSLFSGADPRLPILSQAKLDMTILREGRPLKATGR